jgi:hypothetical protein
MTSRPGDPPEPQPAERGPAHRLEPEPDAVDDRQAATDAPSESGHPADPVSRPPVDDPLAEDMPADGRHAPDSSASGPREPDPPVAEPASDPAGADESRGDDPAPASSTDAAQRPADAPPGPDPDATTTTRRRSATPSPTVRPGRDPFATAPLAAVGQRPDEARGADVRLTKGRPLPPPTGPHASVSRAAAPIFGDEPTVGEAAGADSGATHRYPAYAPGAPTIVDDAPTEAFPVTASAAGRHRADAADEGDLVGEWRAPRKTSRMTMALLALLLVVLGFFGGVLVGRSAAGHATSGDTGRPAATGSVRPGSLR